MSVLTAPRELFFSRTLPRERADARFKALARVLHPDNLDTGDLVLMQRLNAEFDAFSQGTLRPAEVDPLPPRYSVPPQAREAMRHAQELRRRMVEEAGQRLINQLPLYLRQEILFTISVELERVVANGSATYELREALKRYGFRWDPAGKVWFAEVQP